MYSATRSKSFFTIVMLIIPIVMGFWLTPVVHAEWFQANEEDTYSAFPSLTPKLDGVQEASWAVCAVFKEGNIQPNLEFQMKYNGSMAYCLITVKNNIHSANESILLMLSNNGTSLTDLKYFTDEKYIDINNNTEDRRLQAGEYVLDDVQNITGKASLFEPSGKNYTVYEFGFSYNNTNPDQDIVWIFGNTYLAQIRVGDAVTKQYVNYTSFGILFGPPGNATTPGLGEFVFDMNLVTWISFGVAAGIFGILGIFTLISKKMVVTLPIGRTPEEREKQPETVSKDAEGEEEEETGEEETGEDQEEE